jgi:hypothetical protein
VQKRCAWSSPGFYAAVSPFFYAVPPAWACFRTCRRSGAQRFLADGTINNQYWGIKTDDSASAAGNVAALKQCPRLAFATAEPTSALSRDLLRGRSSTPGYSVSDKSIAVPSGISFDLNGSTLIQVPNNKEGYAIFTIVGSEDVACLTARWWETARPQLCQQLRQHPRVRLRHRYPRFLRVELSDLDIYNIRAIPSWWAAKTPIFPRAGHFRKHHHLGCKFHDNRRQGRQRHRRQRRGDHGCEIYNIGIENGTSPIAAASIWKTSWTGLVEYVSISGTASTAIKTRL